MFMVSGSRDLDCRAAPEFTGRLAGGLGNETLGTIR
jgi:hypothetical protein